MTGNTLAAEPGRSTISASVKKNRRRERLPYLMFLPALVFLLIITLPPFLYGLAISFTNWPLTIPSEGQAFVGLSNYRDLLHNPDFFQIVKTTLIYTVSAVGLSFLIGFGIALLLNKPIRGRGLYQTLLLVPMVSTPVVIGLGFKYMYNSQYGIITYLLSLIGLPRVSFLGDPSLALAAVIAVEIWQWTPFVALVLLAGLESQPRQPLEAANVDGASRIQIFRYITLPQMKRVIMVVLLIRTMDALRSFDLIYMMTRGGPGNTTETLIMSAWRQGFSFFNMGIAAAIAMMMLYLVLVSSWTFMHAATTETAAGGASAVGTETPVAAASGDGEV